MIVTPEHHLEWVVIRHLVFRLATLTACCSALANFLPNTKKLDRYPDTQCLYEILVFLVAVFAFNWRAHLPGLDAEFLGFRAVYDDRPLVHFRRRWRHHRDRKKARGLRA